MPPAARIGDMVLQTLPHCHAPIHPPAPTPTPVPHPALPLNIVKGQANVLTGNMPQSRITDMTRPCTIPPCVPAGPGMIIKGSFTVLVGNLPAARAGDMTTHLSCVAPIPSPTGSIIPPCCVTVMIGDAGGGGAGGLGGMVGGAMGMLAGMGAGLMSGGPMGALQGAIAGGIAGSHAGPAGAIEAGSDAATPDGPFAGTATMNPDGTMTVEAGNSIVIEGSPEFCESTMEGLAQINGTESGAALINDIQSSDHQVTIVETSAGNKVTNFGPDGKVNADGTNGAGQGSTVHYNPNRTSIGSEGWQTRPPAIGLAHELVHARHAQEGSIDLSQSQNDSVPDPSGGTATTYTEEVRTVGLPPYQNEPYSENAIRDDWHPQQPQRPYY